MVVEILCYKRLVAGSRSDDVNEFFLNLLNLSALGPGAYSDSNRNE
jgi:hypothetical protein